MFDSLADLTPSDLTEQLRRRFGFQDFRHGQREVIDAVIARRDVLAVMPTGQGKSLCFQLPATLTPGLTVVISPLIALMKDQVDALRARGIAASAFHSALTDQERDRVIQDMRLGRLRLLYLAPERMQHGWFLRLLRSADPSLLVVDEAHCISHWGHDFRPDYLRLADLRRQLNAPPCLAMTATATVKVQDDICDKLELRLPVRIVTGFRRPNLQFSVEMCASKNDKLDAVQRLLQDHRVGSALIYCATRRHVEELATTLGRSRSGVGYYHAGLPDEVRAAIHDLFATGKTTVLVATNAFGMGIDKADVRTVIHYDVPGSVEAYYQEAGRAGRDGTPARCVLLFQHGDVATQEFFIQKLAEKAHVSGTPSPEGRGQGEGEKVERQKGEEQTAGMQRQEACRDLLRQMVAYAYVPACRQRVLLEYFGDQEAGTLGSCGHCDRCRANPVSRVEDAEILAQVRILLQTVARFHGRFGATRLTDLLYGSTAKSIVESRLHVTESFGRLRSLGRQGIARLLRRLIASGHVRVEGLEYPVLELTAKGTAVLDGSESLVWQETSEDGGSTNRAVRMEKSPKGEWPHSALQVMAVDHQLFERLRSLRAEIATDEGIAAFKVFHDKTLRHIASTRPASLGELEAVPGIGPAKLERYGRQLLSVVNGDFSN